MEQRSTFVTVVGWIFIVFSALGLLEMLAFMFLPFDKFMANVPQQKGVPAPDPALIASMFHFMMLVGAAISAWVLLSSIGLVMRKPWARISFMIIVVLGLIFSGLYFLFGLIAYAFMPSAALPGQPPEMAGFAHGMMLFVMVFGGVFAGLYGWILYMLNREHIKKEFQPATKQG